MNLCYCDESGTGDEQIAVMVGIVVDCQRMHITKEHWGQLLDRLSGIIGKQVSEIHTRNFYHGNGIWREMSGEQRAAYISSIFQWIADRKHEIVYSSVDKEMYHRNFSAQRVHDELNTHWRFLGFHLVLAMQKHCQAEQKTKGHTIFVFDNEERERVRFTDIIMRPPKWSDEYYGRTKKQAALDQVVDVPYFGDSQEVALIQLADFVAFFLRRYAEIKSGIDKPRYGDEEARVTEWVESISKRSIGRSKMYPKVGRNKAEDLFFQNAAAAIRDLG